MSNLGWKVGLATSLAVNLFVVGIAVGALGQHRRSLDVRHGPMPRAPLMRIAEDLPQDKQLAFRQRMRAVAEANQSQADASRAARQRVAEAFAAPSFDPALANQALAKAREAEASMRATMEGAVVDFARGLDTEDRKALARGLSRPPGRGGGRGRGGPEDHGRSFAPGGPPPAP